MEFIPLDPRVWPGAAILFVLLCLITLRFKSRLLVFIVTLFLAGHLMFFRDFARSTPATEAPVAPADGKIVEISRVDEDKFLGKETVKIGIFLSIFDNHVTRAPIQGRIDYQHYVHGRFVNALKNESSDSNESNWIGISGMSRRVLIRQIAGAVARRIYSDVKLEETVEAGQKIGIICYGSRVEFYAPAESFRPSVRLNDRVRAGETPLGEWIS